MLSSFWLSLSADLLDSVTLSSTGGIFMKRKHTNLSNTNREKKNNIEMKIIIMRRRSDISRLNKLCYSVEY